MLICVSPPDAFDPVYISATDVTCVKGPIRVDIPKGPGKTEQTWVVEYWMREGIKHAINYPSQDLGKSHAALILSANA
jgi:hypothetical protein